VINPMNSYDEEGGSAQFLVQIHQLKSILSWHLVVVFHQYFMPDYPQFPSE